MTRLSYCVLVRMYIVGVGGSLPVLFWTVVIVCLALEKIAFVVVGSFNRHTPRFEILIRCSKLGS